MAIYIGGMKRQFASPEEGGIFILKSHIVDSKLKSSDDYILKDENNIYLTSKEDKK